MVTFILSTEIAVPVAGSGVVVVAVVSVTFVSIAFVVDAVVSIIR